MSRSLLTLLPVAALAAATACSDPSAPAPLAPTAASLAASDKGGGKGSPHFSDETTCTFNNLTGRLACDYQISGLAANASGAGSLLGNIALTYLCDRKYLPDYPVTTVRLAIDFLYFADKSGNARGHVEGTPIIPPLCLLGGVATDVWYGLDPYASPTLLPTNGQWTLDAAVVTAKGGLRTIFFGGFWYSEMP